MTTCLFILSLCSLSLFFAWRTALTWAAPFLAVCCTFFVHLGAAFLGQYSLGRVSLAVVSGLLGLYALIRIFQKQKDGQVYALQADRLGLSWRMLIAPSLLFACGLFLFAWHYAEARLTYWDEFYWGGFVKHLVINDGFWTWFDSMPRHDSVLLYPPGITILQGLFQPIHAFHEGYIGLAEGCVLLAATGLILEVAHKRIKDPLAYVAFALLAFCSLRLLGSIVRNFSYVFAYAESIQCSFYSALSVFIVFEIKSVRSLDIRRTLLLVLGFGVLALCKPTGIFLTCFATGSLGMILLARSVETYCTRQGIMSLKDFVKGLDLEKCKAILGSVFVPIVKSVCLVLVPSVCLWLAWQGYTKGVILAGTEDVFGDMKANSWDRLGFVCLHYVWAFFCKSLYNIPYLLKDFGIFANNCAVFCTLALLLTYAVSRQGLRLRVSHKLILLYFFLTWVLWIFAHIYVTVQYFTPAEQGYAASYERYIPIILGPSVVMVLLFFMQALSLRKEQARRQERTGALAKGSVPQKTEKQKRMAVLLVRLCFVVAFIPCLLFTVMRTQIVPEPIQEMQKAAALLEANLPKGARYMLITGQKRYELNNACQLYVLPDLREARVDHKTPFNPHASLMNELSTGHLPETFQTLAQTFSIDYLLIWQAPNVFWEKQGVVLGLDQIKKTPILLDLRMWREGQAAFPAQVILHP